MRNFKTFAVFGLLFTLASCANNGAAGNNNMLGNLLGAAMGGGNNNAAASLLSNAIGIGNITGGNSLVSNDVFKGVLQQVLGSNGFLNTSDPKYTLDADISSLASSLTGNGNGAGAVDYKLTDILSGQNLVNKAVSGTSNNSGNSSMLSSIGGLLGGGSNTASGNATSAIANNAGSLIGLLNGFSAQ